MRLAALFVALIATSTSVFAQAPCGTITKNTKLKANCVGPMVIEADNIVVDLKNFSVLCSGEESTQQGVVLQNRKGVTVKYGTINCPNPLVVSGGESNKFKHLVLDSERFDHNNAAFLENTNNNLFYMVTARGGWESRALLVENGNGNMFDRLTLSSSERTSVSITGSGNTLKKSTINTVCPDSLGIYLFGNNNLIDTNKVEAMAAEKGISIFGNGNTIQRNSFAYALIGVSLEGQGNLVKKNTISGLDYGAIIDGSGNRMVENYAQNNTTIDLTDHAVCGSNTWYRNRFGTDSEGDGPKKGCIQ